MIAREKPPTTESERHDSGKPESSSGAAADLGETGNEPSPFGPLLRHLSELQMLAGHYIRARADQITARVRTLLFWAIAGAIGLIIAVAFLVTAVVLVLRGIADGLVRLHLQSWAAELVTGVVCIGAVASAMAIVSWSQKKAARRKRHDDYEHFRARYRAKFGHGFDETGRNGK
jgi:hypothetical protein